MSNKPPDDGDLDQYLAILQSIETDLVGTQRNKFYATEEDRKAYHLHLQAFHAGADFRLRAVLGGNRSGKTTAKTLYMKAAPVPAA